MIPSLVIFHLIRDVVSSECNILCNCQHRILDTEMGWELEALILNSILKIFSKSPSLLVWFY